MKCKNISVVRIWEGLGNQMFQYAYARALQEKHEQTVYLEGRRIFRERLPYEDTKVERKCLLPNFQITLKFIKPSYLTGWRYLEQKTPFQKLRYYLARQALGKYKFYNDFADITAFHKELMEPTGNAYIMGHFLNRKYFEPIREILLREFTLKKELHIPQSLKAVLESGQAISVHIRRGDYLHVSCVQAVNREMQKGRYYQRAMEYCAKQMQEPTFLIFSDDIAWVKENVLCPGRRILVSEMGLRDYEEMMLMSLCRANIIANSTFSYWGAWLNQNKDKTVIAPKHWMPSILPATWIQM